MSCKCGGGSHFHDHIGPPGHDCNHINHTFDPNPPSFYGTWNHLYGHDCTNRVSVCQPGVQSGLYRKCGPLNCSCCGKVTMLTGVETMAKIILSVKLSYSMSEMNKIVDIEPGRVYTIDYLQDGEVCTCTGLVTNIYKVNQLDESTTIYKINIDCSAHYSHKVVVVKSDQLRGVKAYIPYADEDTSLTSAWHEYGTTICATIKDAVVVNAELDKDRNLVKGTIISGTLEHSTTVGGVCIGTNPNGHDIILSGASSNGGTILEGYILNGVVTSGDVDGEVEEDTGYITRATVKGTISNVVICNSKVSGVSVKSGIGNVVEPVMSSSRVVGATVSGDDMITVGGVTSGNITTGGITTGGVAQGGTAYGEINGQDYTLTGGTTIAPEGYSLTTSCGIVVGGVIVGGTKIGNVIYNATIKGGVAMHGTTTGGTTSAVITAKTAEESYKYSKSMSGGSSSSEISANAISLIPGTAVASETPIVKTILQNPNYNQVMEMVQREALGKDWETNKSFTSDDLIIATDRETHTQTFTNFGSALIEGVEPYN